MFGQSFSIGQEFLDAFEIVGGGRFFLQSNETTRPYVSIHAVSTGFDDVGGIDIGDQLGIDPHETMRDAVAEAVANAAAATPEEASR